MDQAELNNDLFKSFYDGLIREEPWNDRDIINWRKRMERRTVLRAPSDKLPHFAYDDLVTSRVQNINIPGLVIEPYGTLQYIPSFRGQPYQLWAIRSEEMDFTKPTALFTGGVHGYETSGITGVLEMMEQRAEEYLHDFNVVAAPCMNPWGFDTYNRMNADFVNINREGYRGTRCKEMAELITYVDQLPDIQIHVDCHETTDTDRDVFRPELAISKGEKSGIEHIPHGFYGVGTEGFPNVAFEQAVIDGVADVTKIAEPDAQGRLIGQKMEHRGIIYYPLSARLCANFSGAHGSSRIGAITTEVYPDAPGMTEEECNVAQVAAMCAALDFAREKLRLRR